MRFLLATHVLLWEIVVKNRVRRLDINIDVVIDALEPASKIQLLAISPKHLQALRQLPFFEQHRDPFDHLSIAQAMADGMMLVTNDRHASLYTVPIQAV